MKYSAHDFGYSIIPKLIGTNRVFAYRFNGYWNDIGTIESYYRTNLDLIDKLSILKVNKKWPAPGHAGSISHGNFGNGRNAIHSLISYGCIIKGRVENSVLSPDVVINEKAVIKNSTIMAASSIGEYSYIEDCIIQEGVSTGDYCSIGINGGPQNDRLAITVIGPGISVPSFTTIYRGNNVICSNI